MLFRSQPGTGPLPAPVGTQDGPVAQPDAPSSPPEASRAEARPVKASPSEASRAEASPAAAAPAEASRADEAGPRRRSRVILAAAAAAVVVAGIVVSVVLASANSPGRHRATAPPASSRSASASKRPTASPSARTSPTASPSASASASAGSGAMPAGFYRFTNSTGFSIGVPKGWEIQHVGHYVYLRDPGESGVFLLIDQSDQPQPNALSDWKAQAAARQIGRASCRERV